MRTAKASVYIGTDDAAWLTVESPSEIAALMATAPSDGLIQLTLGNQSTWNGKPLWLRNSAITAVSSPKDQDEDDEDT